MHSWDSLSIAEQTLMRRAILGYSLAGMVQNYGMALRWAGAAEAPPPRSYTEDEQRALVPQLATVALGLAERGLLTVHEGEGHHAAAPVLVTGPELHEVLTDPNNWLWTARPSRHFSFAARVRALVQRRASDCRHQRASHDELSVEERKVLVCAAEASGMLTGTFGIWQDPPADLDTTQRLAWVDQQLAPLLPFVREGWIEIWHHPDEHNDAFTGRQRRLRLHLHQAGRLARWLKQRMGAPTQLRLTRARRRSTVSAVPPTQPQGQLIKFR